MADPECGLFLFDFISGDRNRMLDGLPFELAEASQRSNGNEAQHKEGEGEDGAELAAGGGEDPIPLGQHGKGTDGCHGKVSAYNTAAQCNGQTHRTPGEQRQQEG